MFAKSYYIVRSLLFISVYSIFFIVQVFANVAAASPGSIFSKAHVHLSGIHQYSQKGLLHAASSVAKKSGIRLNKRFHPETIPSVAYTVTAILPVTISSVKTGKPEAYLLIASILADSLRGPPVVA